MIIQYIGHSAFYLRHGDFGILIDPFIHHNPVAKFDINNKIITHILLTHGHGDHLGDAIPIAKQTGATIIAVFELANYCASKGVNVISVGIGGTIVLPFGKIMFLPAFHSSSTPDGTYSGMPASILIDFDGIKIYHAGDTSLNTEMKLIGELYAPDYSMLPVDGNFTMGIKEATIAAKFLRSKIVIPIHYNTFEGQNINIENMRPLLEAQNQELIVMNPGDNFEI